MNIETRLRLLRHLEQDPTLNQRQLAEKMGVSLGKTNYAIRALIERGWIKVGNFSKSPTKGKYLYQLTPAGITAKARITKRFLQRKLQEHEALLKEIEELKNEVNSAKEGSRIKVQGSR